MPKHEDAKYAPIIPLHAVLLAEVPLATFLFDPECPHCQTPPGRDYY